MSVPRKYDVHCKFNGKGCAKEDTCYLGREKARRECGYHAYFDFLKRFGYDLDECLAPAEGSRYGCKDLNMAGLCMDTNVYCPLFDYND